jgi:nucleotide-binding universal stress UspA family protein
MAKRVLVPVDESEQSLTALEYALGVHPDATFTLLHVIDPRDFRTYGGIEGSIDMQQIANDEWEHARRVVDEAREQAEAHGVSATTEIITGKAPRAIVEFVEEHDPDLVIMGSHGRSGVSRVLLGSVAERVVRRSPIPVTVVR